MIKNKLFTIITIVSLSTFMCYGMEDNDCLRLSENALTYKANNSTITYYHKIGTTSVYDHETKTFTIYDHAAQEAIELPSINIQNETELLHIDKQQTTTNYKKLPIVKLSQPASMNIINGPSNRLGNLQRELDLLASPKRRHGLLNTLKRKIIKTNYNTLNLSFNSAKQTTT